ncbi:phytanoyl-CoA dioxygenase family protein [Rubripirellula sp.]|nr:phytanoyl-CoA dioxygenase family protein [Rubripirellula sp.]MDB4338497.1 phytanoyl-CoA dioxygenase family protein [Rubripirellula sp.]
MMLTRSEIEQYNRDGYVSPDFCLDEATLDQIREAHSRLVSHHSEFSDYCSALLAYDTWFLSVARRPEILDMVEQVIGSDFALWNCSFFAKPAKVGTRTPWHQDGEYWPIEPLATCTVWIALDASTKENGCLRVIPGSHKSRQLAKHNRSDASDVALNLELDEAEFDESEAVDITLKPGEVSLHDVYLYHGSEPNLSDYPRRGMTLRYMPTSSIYCHNDETRFEREGRLDMSNRTIYLMRGNDQSGRNDFRMRY